MMNVLDRFNRFTQVCVQHLMLVMMVGVAVLARVVPHLAEVSPLLIFSLYFGARCSRGLALLLIAVMAVLSDVLIGTMGHFAMFGAWTWFTLSGVLCVGMFGGVCRRYFKGEFFGGKFLRVLAKFLGAGSIVTLLYWAWTNFGSWLISGMYPQSGVGLVNCMIMGLPFLGRELLGSMVWGGLIVLLERGIMRSSLRVSPSWQVYSPWQSRKPIRSK